MRERKTCTEFRNFYRAALRGPRASAVNAERRMPQRIFAVSHATSLEAACLSRSLFCSLSLSRFRCVPRSSCSQCVYARTSSRLAKTIPRRWRLLRHFQCRLFIFAARGSTFFFAFAYFPFCFSFSFLFLFCLICYCYCYCCCYCCCLIKWLWEHAIRVHCQMLSVIDLYSRARPRLTRVATHWTRNGKFCLCFFDTEKRERVFCPTTFALAPLQTTVDWRCCCRDLHFQPASRASGSSGSEESDEREQ